MLMVVTLEELSNLYQAKQLLLGLLKNSHNLICVLRLCTEIFFSTFCFHFVYSTFFLMCLMYCLLKIQPFHWRTMSSLCILFPLPRLLMPTSCPLCSRVSSPVAHLP